MNKKSVFQQIQERAKKAIVTEQEKLQKESKIWKLYCIQKRCESVETRSFCGLTSVLSQGFEQLVQYHVTNLSRYTTILY